MDSEIKDRGYNPPKVHIIYRVRYSRGQEVRYVSHIDILRLFDRAARRGNVPLAYSQGFNPHPQIVFGMPLPVGLTSDAEYADIELTEDIGGEDLIKRFNGAMPPAVKFLEAERLSQGAVNIMKSVSASKYSVAITCDGINPKDAVSKFNSFLETGEELIAEKKTKNFVKETNIRPMIKELIAGDCGDTEGIVIITTSAGNEVNLRPELALTALAAKCGVSMEIGHIHRLLLM